MYFKYLAKQLSASADFKNVELCSEETTVQEFRYSNDEIRGIRLLYEHTCELTNKLDDAINLPPGNLILVMIPFICFTTYSTFIPEFRSDLLFYSLFAFFCCLVIQLTTANLNSQVTFQIHSIEKVVYSLLRHKLKINEIIEFFQIEF